MITKIGIEYNKRKLNYNNCKAINPVCRPVFQEKVLGDTFISFGGKDSQKTKMENIMLYADSSTKKMFEVLTKDAKEDGYNSITPMHVVKYSLEKTAEYIEDLDKEKEEFNTEEMTDMAKFLSGDITPEIFSDKKLRKKIKPIINSYIKITENKLSKNKETSSGKKQILTDELIDNIWSSREGKNEPITPFLVLSAVLCDDANEEIYDLTEDMLDEIREKTMVNDTPLKERKPFSGYEERAKSVLKNLALGTNMFITYDISKDDPQGFIDTIHKIVESGGNTKIIELNNNATVDFFQDKINQIKKDKKQDYILIADPMYIIFNFTPPEVIAEGKFTIPQPLMNCTNNLPQNLKLLLYDTKNNYYTFGDMANYNKYQEISIPSLNSDQMIKYFKENPKLVKDLKKPFTKSAVDKAVAASAQLDGEFPKKSVDLLQKIVSYNINKKEITDKEVNEYLKEATNLLKKQNDDSSVEVVFDTGKHLKQMTGRLSTKKEAEQIVRQIKTKKLGTKGLIIYSQDGTPGSGRKFTVQAIAGDAKVPYVEINTMDFGTKDVEIFGNSLSPEASMKKLFSMVKTQAEANPNKSAVLFIENFEYFAIGELVSHYHQKAMAQLLREMEKAENQGLNILVAGSVSNPDLIGEATMKSFKFVDSIEVSSPAINNYDREQIIEQALKDNRFKFADNKEAIIKYASDITEGFPYIQLKNLIKKAKSVAQERNHKNLTKGDITEAYLQLTTGRPSTNNINEHEKHIVASHECGHATNLTIMNNIARKYGKAWHIPQKVNFVTLDPRGFYGGAVYHGNDINEEGSFEYNFSELVCAFGGNSAEKYFFDIDGSWGITSDMDHVRRLSSAMVKKMGLGANVGKMNVGANDSLSDNMKQMVENDQRVIINNAKITSELITEMYADFNDWFTNKYSPLVGTGECLVDGDEFRKALMNWISEQSPAKQKELELCDETILKIIDATKRGIAVQKK